MSSVLSQIDLIFIPTTEMDLYKICEGRQSYSAVWIQNHRFLSASHGKRIVNATLLPKSGHIYGKKGGPDEH